MIKDDIHETEEANKRMRAALAFIATYVGDYEEGVAIPDLARYWERRADMFQRVANKALR